MIDPTRPLLNLTGRVSVRYTLSFVVVVFVVACLSCLGLAAVVSGALRWAFFGLGLAALALPAWLACYAVMRRPELLRSEELQTFGQFLEWTNALEIDDLARLRGQSLSTA